MPELERILKGTLTLLGQNIRTPRGISGTTTAGRGPEEIISTNLALQQIHRESVRRLQHLSDMTRAWG